MTKLVSASDVAHLLYSVLPRGWLFALARVYGRLTHLSDRSRRSTVRRNLADAFGATKSSSEIDSLTRRFFEYKRARELLLALAPRLTGREMAKLFPVHGLEHLDDALQQQRGVILLGSHLNSGCMFNAIVMLRGRGYDIRVALPEPGEPWPPSLLRTILNRYFNAKPLTELIGAFYAQFNIRPIVRCLAENVIVAQTGDGLHSARFVEVDFLGRRVPFPTGMASIAQMTGAVIVPIFQVGAPPDRLRIVVEEPWMVERADGERALENAVAHYARRLEHHLLENAPCWEHWLIEDTLATMTAWPQKSLKERYAV